MLRYLIDGYNLLHAWGILQGPVGPHGLEKARLALLGHLRGRLGDGVTEAAVVFDASRAPPGVPDKEDYHGLHVHYALDQEADDLIEGIIGQHSAPRRLTVVSDDHRIQQAARRRRCQVQGCLVFVDWLHRRATPPADPDAPAKPEGVSAAETERWLREFADLVNDPRLQDPFDRDPPRKP